jgi:hypothetical protein
VLGQQFHQHPKTGDVIANAAFGDELSALIHQRDVVPVSRANRTYV